jgi:hypothetical protein
MAKRIEEINGKIGTGIDAAVEPLKVVKIVWVMCCPEGPAG